MSGRPGQPGLIAGDGDPLPVGAGVGGGLGLVGSVTVGDGVGGITVGVGVAVGGGGGGLLTGEDQVMVTVSPPGAKAMAACPEASCARLTVTVTVTGRPGCTVPPVALSVRSGDDVWADQATGPPSAVSVISPVEPAPRPSWVGETWSRPLSGGGVLALGRDGPGTGPGSRTGVPRR